MNDEKFCPACEDYRVFSTEKRGETYTVRGREISMPVTVEVCSACGESLFDEARDEDLLRRAYAEYRQIEGLLTAEEIKAIRDRYRLSQKSLAALLGMSEATINRYERGAPQDRAHDTAIRACTNPDCMGELVARNGHLLSDWQRKRVERALAGGAESVEDAVPDINLAKYTSMPDELSHRTGFRRFDYRRYAAVVVWFCRNLEAAVTQTKLYKLLFYADFLSFRTISVSLTGAAYRKMTYGPVPADYGNLRDRLEYDDYVMVQEVVYRNDRTGEEYRLGPRADEVPYKLTLRELAVLERVAAAFGDATPSAISERSHREPAWLNTQDKQLISYKEAASLSLSASE